MPPLMLNVLLLLLTCAACFTFYRAVRQPQRPVAKRLAGEGEAERRLSGGLSVVVQQAIEKWPMGTPTASPAEQKLSGTLSYAGFRSARAAAVYQTLRGALMISFSLTGAALGASLGKSVLGLAATGCAFGYLLPTLVIQRLATMRRLRIKAELPDVLALLVVSLEAGVGLGEAVRLVGHESERQGRLMGRELSATAAHMAAGRSLEDSLKDLGERTGVDEVKSLAALVIQSEKVGARIAPALRASAELLSSQRRLAAEEAAHKAAIKMLVPLIFLILPAMMLIVIGPAMIQVFRTFTSK